MNLSQRGFRYTELEHITWPLGGVGSSLLALTGAGGLDRIANRHRPDIKGMSFSFTALSFPGRPELTRVLEGPVPDWKVWTQGFYTPGRKGSCATGDTGAFHHGLPRFGGAEFFNRFPFAEVLLGEKDYPLECSLEAWSPFIPGNEDDSNLPAAALTYRFRNSGSQPVAAVFSWHGTREFLRDRDAKGEGERFRRTPHGIVIDYPATADAPWAAGGLSVEIDGAAADCAWFRGGWFDARTMLWQNISSGAWSEKGPHAEGDPGEGASLWLPIEVPARSEVSVTVRIAWHEPFSNQRHPSKGAEKDLPAYRPRYAELFPTADAVAAAFRSRFDELRGRTSAFAEALHATDIPAEALEAVTANLGILRSPTVLRQHDGRLWNWEGCGEWSGSCHGSCTHVWNYAQAAAHLFPGLERSLRETEFFESQDERGHQNFRAALPIGPADHDFYAAADGQLGGIVKAWREWQISGDAEWLRRLWPRLRSSLDYCIATWDPGRTGALTEPHHNTYDIEFHGPDGMCGSIYASALKAGIAIAGALDENAATWQALLDKAVAHLENNLFRGARFIQQVDRPGDIKSTDRITDSSLLPGGAFDSPEAVALREKEGPKYQYGHGVLSDGVFGAWLAEISGLGSPLDPEKVRSHLRQIHRHNLRRDLSGHANPQRPSYAIGDEGGLLLCTWPEGGKPALPFVYSDEVWTGIEYQVASHCILSGLAEEGLEIVRVARSRYDGRRRNPFDEYECGHWYGRALASWALLQALTGIRYSAVERTLWVAPVSAQRPFRSYFGTGGNFGTLTLENDSLTLALAEGSLEIENVVISGRAHPCKAKITARQVWHFPFSQP